MVHNAASLIVFAKAPEQGKVKTRLEGFFSPHQILAIYEAMLRDVLELVQDLQDQIPHISVYWTGDTRPTPPSKWVQEFATLHHDIQRGDDLGARMYHAMEDEFARGRQKILLIGCDSPHLPSGFVLQALDRLETEDWVLGPSTDGGYYLIGATCLLKDPFKGIEWGTEMVLEQSLAVLKDMGLRVGLLPPWSDLDREEDLQNFLKDGAGSDTARNLRSVLNSVAKRP